MATNYQPTFMWLLREGLQHPAPCRRLFLGSWRRRPQLSLLGGEEPKDCNPFWFAGPPGQGAHFLISERSWIKKETYFLELIWYLVGMLFRWQGYRHRGGTDVIYTLIIIWMRVQIGLFRGLGITWTAFLLIFIPSERPGPPDIFKSPAPSWWHTEFYDSKQSSEALSTDAIQHCAFTLFFSLCSGLIRNISKIKLNLNNFFW